MLLWRRDCSAAFHLAPYEGKYEPPDQAPDALHVQKLLAGMADRGADVAVVECAAEGLDRGRWSAPLNTRSSLPLVTTSLLWQALTDMLLCTQYAQLPAAVVMNARGFCAPE